MELFIIFSYDAYMTDAEKQQILREYAQGGMGTRTAMEKIGAQDFADLIIALAKHDLSLPESDPAGREDHIRRAAAILRPRLQLHA